MSDPENPFTKQQWAIKRSFAVKADSLSRLMLKQAVPVTAKDADAVDVYNTSSWKRTGWVVMEDKIDLQNKVIKDDKGKEIPCQILSDGRTAFYAENIPPLGSKRYYIAQQKSKLEGSLSSSGNKISNNLISIEVDKNTGNIISLNTAGSGHNYADTSKNKGLLDYQYVNEEGPINMKRFQMSE